MTSEYQLESSRKASVDYVLESSTRRNTESLLGKIINHDHPKKAFFRTKFETLKTPERASMTSVQSFRSVLKYSKPKRIVDHRS